MSETVPPQSRKRRRIAVSLCVVLLLGVVVWLSLLRSGAIKRPYRGVQRRIAWVGGFEDDSYNFGEVVPGKIYRSARPDERWLRELHRRYGIQRVIDLDGGDKISYAGAARELGISLKHVDWTSRALPPEEELKRALSWLEKPGPVLIHCSAGKDRTGYLVASYRMRVQGWPPEKVIEEMDSFWHRARRKPHFQQELTRWWAANRGR